MDIIRTDKIQNNTVNSREGNYDLLRIIATVAVIIIHVSGFYKDAITDAAVLGRLYSNHIFTIVIYNTLSRFAVPCFMMLSGAFLVANDKNADYKYFYKKSFNSIGIPTIVFTILYFLYSEALGVTKVFIRGESTSLIFKPIRDVLVGAPFYHMWYLYTLIAVYLFIPCLVKIRMELSEQSFAKLSWIALIVTTISGWTSSFLLQWSISKAICYIGYVLVGYEIRRFFLHRKSNSRALITIIVAIMIEVALAYVQYNHSLRGLSENDEKYSLIGNFNPIVVIASVLIFVAFSQMRIEGKWCSKLAGDSFEVYLFHAGVVSVLSQFVKKIDGKVVDCRLIIPVWVAIVFILSLILAKIYKALIKKLHCK